MPNPSPPGPAEPVPEPGLLWQTGPPMTLQAPPSALAARYLATYRGKPRKAAAAIRGARAQAQAARQRGDQADATDWEDVADTLEAHLRTTGSCSMCGRALTDPESVARGIGPDCLKGGR